MLCMIVTVDPVNGCEEVVGRVGMYPDALLRILDVQRAGRIENDVGQLIGRIETVRGLPAEAHVLERGEPFGVVGTDRVQLEFHASRHCQPEALEQLRRRFVRDPAARCSTTGAGWWAS
jgi:hypothetical protein